MFKTKRTAMQKALDNFDQNSSTFVIAGPTHDGTVAGYVECQDDNNAILIDGLKRIIKTLKNTDG